jgi:hypothetical protein
LVVFSVGALFGVGAAGFIDPAGRFRLIPDFVLLHPGLLTYAGFRLILDFVLLHTGYVC